MVLTPGRYGSNLPNRVHLLLAWRLRLAHIHVSCLVCAAGNLQELIKLQHPALAARPALATLVEDRLAWVVHALLIIPRCRPRICSTATSSTACRISRDLQVRVVRVWLWGRSWCGGRRSCDSGVDGRSLREGLDGSGSRSRRSFSLLGGLGSGRVVDGRVLTRGARWDGEELLKGQNAGFAAFPALNEVSSDRGFMTRAFLNCPIDWSSFDSDKRKETKEECDRQGQDRNRSSTKVLYLSGPRGTLEDPDGTRSLPPDRRRSSHIPCGRTCRP